MTYSKRYFVIWNGRESKRYLMHGALALARRMRARGHAVVVACGSGKGA
jgi:phosphoserine phosphatase